MRWWGGQAVHAAVGSMKVLARDEVERHRRANESITGSSVDANWQARKKMARPEK
jgi:hypothetical protein